MRDREDIELVGGFVTAGHLNSMTQISHGKNCMPFWQLCTHETFCGGIKKYSLTVTTKQ